MRGATCVITGATSGIGRATALGLARLGAKVVIVARNSTKMDDVASEIATIPGAPLAQTIQADLSEMSQVAAAAAEIGRRLDCVDVLISNAGGMFDTYLRSSEGIELAYAVNHLAPFVLTQRLRETLKKAPHPRVIIVSSNVQRAAYIADYRALTQPKYQWTRTYAQTKLRNLIFTMALSRRWKPDGITVNALHPGVVGTGLMSGWKNPVMKAVFGSATRFFKSPEQGARTSIFLASDPSVKEVTGAYFVGNRQQPHNPAADDLVTQQRLWEEAEAELSAIFPRRLLLRPGDSCPLRTRGP